MHVFLYDSLMKKEELEEIIGKGQMLSIEPAFIHGVTLFDAERQISMHSNLKLKTRFPIMMDKSEIKSRVREPAFVYGACVELSDDYTVFRSLDGYYSCSVFSLGDNKQADMFHRRKVQIRKIKLKSKEAFLRYDYEVKEVVEGYAYYGNLSHSMLKHKFSTKTNHKSIGCVWKTFFTTF